MVRSCIRGSINIISVMFLCIDGLKTGVVSPRDGGLFVRVVSCEMVVFWSIMRSGRPKWYQGSTNIIRVMFVYKRRWF